MKNFKVTSKAIINPNFHAQIVHRADTDFPFLHDTVIFNSATGLILAWYNCSENEILGKTLIRARRSFDKGKTWSSPEIICEDIQGTRHMVPVIFSEVDSDLCAYVTVMSSHDRPTGYICLRFAEGVWEKTVERNIPVLFNTLPQCINGKWIVSGRRAPQIGELPQIPVVAVSDIISPAQWQILDISDECDNGKYPLLCPETSLLISGEKVQAVIRNDYGKAKLSQSHDGGKTWSVMRDTEIPIAPAKTYAGSLPDGRQYLIYNEQTLTHDRSKLVISLRNSPDSCFDHTWIIAEGYNEELQAGPCWHYPCAVVSDGILYISCTVSGEGVTRHAALFSIPVDKL